MIRVIIVLCLSLAVPGCAPRGVLTFLPGDASADGAVTVQPVFVASTRNAVQEGAPPGLDRRVLGAERDARLRFARVDVSIPPGHRLGMIEWPRGGIADPDRHFVTRASTEFANQETFLGALGAAQVSAPSEVLVFVHGYNVNYAEAVYRLAQIAHDFESEVPVIAFSWPSAGEPGGYVYDRDSVIFSRDGLEQLLLALTRDGRSVTLVAHSMGSQLVMEVLRQMSISGERRALAGLSGVALISPDIDEDVFERQAARITPFPQPFMLLVSTRDLALGLSAWLTGKPARLGSISDPKRLEDLPVEVIDLSDIQGGDRAGHATAFTAPAAIALLRDLGNR